jgi:hypothetical protein
MDMPMYNLYWKTPRHGMKIYTMVTNSLYTGKVDSRMSLTRQPRYKIVQYYYIGEYRRGINDNNIQEGDK